MTFSGLAAVHFVADCGQIRAWRTRRRSRSSGTAPIRRCGRSQRSRRHVAHGGRIKADAQDEPPSVALSACDYQYKLRGITLVAMVDEGVSESRQPGEIVALELGLGLCGCVQLS